MHLRDRHHEPAPCRLHQGLDLALVVALAGPAEAVAEQVVRLQMRERLRAPTRAVAQDPRHRKRRVVIEDRSRHTAEEGEGADMAVQEGLRRLPRIGLDEPDVGMGQDQAEEGNLLPPAPDLHHRLAEGWHVNPKRVQRIWRREGLKLPQKQPKRGRLWLNDGSCIRLRPCWPNHVWSYDFVMDRTHDGRKFRMLTVIDEFTRRCMAVVVERRLNSDNVLHCLTELFVQHGPPDHIRSDNGSEFTAHAVRDWLGRIGVKTLYIEPGSPWENGYNESFNSKIRDEILNTEIFYTLKEAKVLIERWRHHYNTIRPHRSLRYRPPAPETILPNVEGPTYAVDGLRLAHQLNPRQTLT